jgi:UDP-N-acetylmuramate dehydrogenase
MRTALNRKMKQWLEIKFQERVKFDEPMATHTSLKVGGPADAFITTENKEELADLIHWAWQSDLKWFVIGGGTNLLISDRGIRGIVIVLTKELEAVSEKPGNGNTYNFKAAAGVKLQSFCRITVEKGAKGMNFAIGIPGTIGGAIAMNAGTSLGSMKDVVEAVTFLLPDKKVVELKKDKLDFRCGGLALEHGVFENIEVSPVILEGCFHLDRGNREAMKKDAEKIRSARRKSQPTSLPNAGCFFKNPVAGEPAGKLIELAGLKGRQVGGAQISEKHANFMVNTGNASAKDFLTLMETVKKKVFERFHIMLEPEVKIAG